MQFSDHSHQMKSEHRKAGKLYLQSEEMLIDFYFKITFNSRCFLSEIRFANNLHERIFSFLISFLLFFYSAFRFTEFSSHEYLF